MKKTLKFGLLTLTLALCGGTVTLIHSNDNKQLKVEAKNDYVAQDGSSNKYATVSEFVSALETKNNETFTLLDSFTLADTIDLAGKTATIDMAGYTITGNVNTMFSLTSSSDLTINSSNGTGIIRNTRQEIFNLTGANLNITSVNLLVGNTTSGYYPINAASGSNIIRMNGVRVTKGLNGILLAGTSYLYTTGATIFSNQGNYSISCGSSCSVFFSGGLDASEPIYTNNTVNFFDGNVGSPTYLTDLSHTLTITVSNSLKHDGDIIVRGIYNNPTLINKITVSGLANSGYDYSVADSGTIDGAKDIKTVYYSCVPSITGNKFTIIRQDNPAVYSTSDSYSVEYVLQADFGYYFGTQRSDYLVITIGGGDPLTSSDYTYGYSETYNAHPYYKRCTINIKKNRIKGQLVIAVTPGLSPYLQTAKDFITNNMHMTDYDSELTGSGSGWCKDISHNYYGTAKTEFLKLGNYYREAFMLSTDEDVVAGRERFLAWADASGDKIVIENGNYNIVRKANVVRPVQEKNNVSYSAVIVVSTVCISSLAVVALFIKKKKESSR